MCLIYDTLNIITFVENFVYLHSKYFHWTSNSSIMSIQFLAINSNISYPTISPQEIRIIVYTSVLLLTNSQTAIRKYNYWHIQACIYVVLSHRSHKLSYCLFANTIKFVFFAILFGLSMSSNWIGVAWYFFLCFRHRTYGTPKILCHQLRLSFPYRP